MNLLDWLVGEMKTVVNSYGCLIVAGFFTAFQYSLTQKMVKNERQYTDLQRRQLVWGDTHGLGSGWPPARVTECQSAMYWSILLCLLQV